jgi:hypothetical protein
VEGVAAVTGVCEVGAVPNELDGVERAVSSPSLAHVTSMHKANDVDADTHQR